MGGKYIFFFVSLHRKTILPMKERKKSAEKEERNKRSAQRDALHAKNWKEYTATVDDIRTFLGGRVFLRHNVITGRVEYRLPDSSEWQPVTDRVVNSLATPRATAGGCLSRWSR